MNSPLIVVAIGCCVLFTPSLSTPIAAGGPVDFTLPEGTTNHGNPKLICLPTKWYHILEFLLINYVAHATTIKSQPGQKWYDNLIDVVLALIFPFSGVVRAINAIESFAWPTSSAIDKALRAGAFCTVARSADWHPSKLSKPEMVQTHMLQAHMFWRPATNSREQNEQRQLTEIEGSELTKANSLGK